MSNLNWTRNSRIDTSTFILMTFYVMLFGARASLGATSVGNLPIIGLSGLFIISTVKYIHPNSIQMGGLIGCIFLGVISVTIGIFRDGYGPADMVGDLSTMIRGPIILLWTWMIAKRISQPERLQRLLQYCWCAASALIFISALTKVGLNTYAAQNLGWKFFFVSNNELTFCYTFLTGILVLNARFKQTVTYLAICSLTLLIIGTKSGFLGIGILGFTLSLRVIRQANRKLGLIYFFLINITLFGIMFIVDLEALFTALLPLLSFSSGYDKVIEKIAYSGFWEGLLSGRGRFITFAALEFVQNNNFIDYLFGIGFSDLKDRFGDNFGRASFIEVDIFDILLSYGFFGIFAYLSFLFYLTKCWLKEFTKGSSKSEVYLFVSLTVLIIGNLSGHVIFSAWTMSTVGLVLGLIENPVRQLTQHHVRPLNSSKSEDQNAH